MTLLVPRMVSGDDGYEDARRVWNRSVDRRPAVIARCVDEPSVVAAVLEARHRGLALSVRGGGHDWAGRSVVDGGLLIDLSGMRGVTVDGRVAEVQGGALAGDVAVAAMPHELAPVVGTVSQVGVTGLTLGGGYGALIGRHGLALDNVVGARVVLADGRVVDATAAENPDLYWALRGGGGNFGVVTALRLRLHPLRTVLAGMVAFPLDQAVAVLQGLRELPASDELSVIAGLFSGGDGPLLALLPAWCGDSAEGERVLATLPALGVPLAVQLGPRTVPDVLGIMDANIANDRSACADSRWLPDLTDAAVDLLVTATRTMTSPHSAIAVHHFHGAACRVPADATAWALRAEHRQVEIIAGWPADEPADRHLDWVARLSAELATHSLPGGYPNLLGPAELARVRLAHGANLDRLVEVKRNYDPDGVFTAVAAAI